MVNNGPASDNERWENQDGYSPNTIATEIAGLICAADIARANGAAGQGGALRGDRRRVAAEGGVLDRDDHRPVLAEALLPARDQGGKPGRRQHVQPRRQLSTAPVDEREIVDNSFLGLVLFGVKKWNDQTILNSLDVGDGNATTPYPLKVDTPSGPVWHRFTYDGYGEQPNGDDWDLFFDNPAARRAAACGRCSPASAASTS